MRVLLDTNILIHREASKVINKEIGILFNWFDKLKCDKCVHPLSLTEIKKHKDVSVVKTIETKIQNYNLLKTLAPETSEIVELRKTHDQDENDKVDTSLLKEVFCNRVDYLISEDRKLHEKARRLNISDRIFTIDSFLEKVTAENPSLSSYKVLAVKKEYFGNIDIKSPFFDSFKNDYKGFEGWFAKKSDEVAYICQASDKSLLAFLYVKIETKSESYVDIKPNFRPARRLKIGTLKVISNGYKLGERFLKIVFDNALINKVDEVYVTLFKKTDEHDRLIGLLTDWGFEFYGIKTSVSGEEEVYVKKFNSIVNCDNSKRTYPFISRKKRHFIVPIYPKYHTELFPDSILNNESPNDFVENAPHRNAIQKVYISRSLNRNLAPGDIILFYRTGGYHASVVTTLGVVESVITSIKDEQEFINMCRKRSVFDDIELKKHWRFSSTKPFIVNFLYLYSFPKRLNMKALIDLKVIADVNSAPRGFELIDANKFETILKESKTDESFIID